MRLWGRCSRCRWCWCRHWCWCSHWCRCRLHSLLLTGCLLHNRLLRNWLLRNWLVHNWLVHGHNWLVQIGPRHLSDARLLRLGGLLRRIDLSSLLHPRRRGQRSLLAVPCRQILLLSVVGNQIIQSQGRCLPNQPPRQHHRHSCPGSRSHRLSIARCESAGIPDVLDETLEL